MARHHPHEEPVEHQQPRPAEPVMKDEEDLRAWLDGKGTFDVVVGINARDVDTTIVHVLNIVCLGLQEHLPGIRALVVVCDGGSSDDTVPMAQFFPVPSDVTKLVMHQLHGPGKGNGVRTIMEVADQVEAQACACVDGDLVSIHSSWIGNLLNPVLYGLTDLVVPYYLRDKWDGVITNHLCYPLNSALYGTSVRQPIGGDYGMSRPFLQHVLAGNAPGDFGIDIHLTTTAIADGFRMQEVPLGIKIHSSTRDYTDPRKTLSRMYLEVVGELLELAGRHEEVWRHPDLRPAVLLSESVVPYYRRLPPTTRVNEQSVREILMEGIEEYQDLLDEVLPDDLRRTLRGVEKEGLGPDDWARIVYAFAAWHLAHSEVGQRPTEDLLHALGALGMGRFLGFVRETQDTPLREANDMVKEQAKVFARHKPVLLEQADRLRKERQQEVRSQVR